jgi:hypothetical protein
MKKSIYLSVFLFFNLFSNSLWASDACLDRAIKTRASVQVSDGSHFITESFYQSAEYSAIKHIREDIQIAAVEGPIAWMSRGDKFQTGGDGLKTFALGHQFHALLLHFDELVSDIKPKSDISFRGEMLNGRGGKYPFGGDTFLVQNPVDDLPKGMVFIFPETPRMEVTFSDWRQHLGATLPFHVQIDDGSRVFEYAYDQIDLIQVSPLWFFDSVEAPGIDSLQIHRLHRRLIAAHCIGDAGMMADLSAPEMTISGRGEFHQQSREELRSRFTQTFQRLNYQEYHDLVDPLIEVSESGDLAWIAVNVRAVGKGVGDARSFDSQWSWVMMAKKIDGAWLNAGNASNHLPQADSEK